MKISAVYSEVLSKKAETVFEQNRINYQWTELVRNVLDLNKHGLCPFEKIAARISDPENAYHAFKTLQEHLKYVSEWLQNMYMF